MASAKASHRTSPGAGNMVRRDGCGPAGSHALLLCAVMGEWQTKRSSAAAHLPRAMSSTLLGRRSVANSSRSSSCPSSGQLSRARHIDGVFAMMALAGGIQRALHSPFAAVISPSARPRPVGSISVSWPDALCCRTYLARARTAQHAFDRRRGSQTPRSSTCWSCTGPSAAYRAPHLPASQTGEIKQRHCACGHAPGAGLGAPQ